VARRHIAQLSCQHIEATFHLCHDVGGREGIDPAGRQLDRQRHPIELTADARYRIQLVARGRELGPQLSGALHKQGHRAGA
jgi:hypothetical protein